MVTAPDGAIIATGQNRIMDPPGGPGPLARTPMAHAEMNALASLPGGPMGGTCEPRAVYTTFEPCLMCAATIIGTYGIPEVAFASCDPTWDGLHRAFRQYPVIAGRLPERKYLGGPYGALAYVIHLTGMLRYWPGPYEPHDRLAPARIARCRQLVEHGTLTHLAEAGADVADVAAALWDDLEELADPAS